MKKFHFSCLYFAEQTMIGGGFLLSGFVLIDEKKKYGFHLDARLNVLLKFLQPDL